jgi:hypothetical protein
MPYEYVREPLTAEEADRLAAVGRSASGASMDKEVRPPPRWRAPRRSWWWDKKKPQSVRRKLQKRPRRWSADARTPVSSSRAK